MEDCAVQAAVECSPVPAGKMHVSYDAIHAAIAASLPKLRRGGYDRPDTLLAISGGGLIPARILRSVLRTAAKGTPSSGCATIKV